MSAANHSLLALSIGSAALLGLTIWPGVPNRVLAGAQNQPVMGA
jgi:hypothetical protein